LIRRQDLGILLLYYLGYSKVRNMVLCFKRMPVARFVTFHDIPAEGEANFRTNLRFLKERTNVVSLDDFFAGRLSWQRTNVVITFDDGYKSWISRALPALLDFGLPAVFFISSGFVGLSDSKAAEFIRVRLGADPGTTSGLTEEDVRRMVAQGFTIGGHTCNHVNLAAMESKEEIHCEILQDKRTLEAITGREVCYFAYPGGAHANQRLDLTGILRDSGYQGAVTVVPGFNDHASPPYLLHR